MDVKIITPPVLTDLVSDADLRKHLRIASDGSEDELVRAYFAAAHAMAEHYTGRPIGTQTREGSLDAFPDGEIEIGPAVSAITSLKYIDAAGAEQTVPGASYSLYAYGLTSWLLPGVGVTWPATQEVAGAVKVRFVAGDLPDAVKAALLLTTAHLFENRGSDKPEQELPCAAVRLLDTVKIWSA